MYTQTQLLTVAFCHQCLHAKQVCLGKPLTSPVLREKLHPSQPTLSMILIAILIFFSVTFYFVFHCTVVHFVIVSPLSNDAIAVLTFTVPASSSRSQNLCMDSISYAPPVWVLGEAAASNRTSASHTAIVECH